MDANMYKIGDYVYFEASSSAPYLIRKIESLIKNPTGNVEAKVSCYVRRRDLTTTLIGQVNKSQLDLEDEQEEEYEAFSDLQRHRLKHRELYLTRQAETLPATHIRGKCSVSLLNERETLVSYLNREDAFFYSRVYDLSQKSLVPNQSEMRVGSKYQAEVPDNPSYADDRDQSELEELKFTPDNKLTDDQIDQFQLLCRSVGTFARALDCSSSVKQPSLHMSAAAASRDITLFHGMDILHQSGYKLAEAIARLVPPGGPLLCRDEMEEWTPSEANLFEEAIEKYGKDFNDIRQDFLPWKSSKNIVEYYYMWKTTDRYVQQKRAKIIEAENKLKQVYIPNYNTTPSHTNTPTMNGTDGRHCDCCQGLTYSQWYPWTHGTVQAHVCSSCWTYWKKYGGLPYISRLDSDGLNNDKDDPDASYPCNNCNKVFNRQERLISHMASHRPHKCTVDNCGKEFKLKAHLNRHCSIAHRLVPVDGGTGGGPPRHVVKTRAAFFFHCTSITRAARLVASRLPSFPPPRLLARRPFYALNLTLVRQELQGKGSGQALSPTIGSNGSKLGRTPANIEQVSARLGIPTHLPCEEWLRLQPLTKNNITGNPRITKDLPSSLHSALPLNDHHLNASFFLPIKMKVYDQLPNGTGPPSQHHPTKKLKLSTKDSTLEVYNLSSSAKGARGWAEVPEEVYFKTSPIIKQQSM